MRRAWDLLKTFLFVGAILLVQAPKPVLAGAAILGVVLALTGHWIIGVILLILAALGTSAQRNLRF